MENIWSKELRLAMDFAGEGDSRVVASTQNLEKLQPPFTVWTQDRVYFPVVYSSTSCWVESVPRNPCLEEVENFLEW